MSKEPLKFGDVEVNKKEIHDPKQPSNFRFGRYKSNSNI